MVKDGDLGHGVRVHLAICLYCHRILIFNESTSTFIDQTLGHPTDMPKHKPKGQLKRQPKEKKSKVYSSLQCSFLSSGSSGSKEEKVVDDATIPQGNCSRPKSALDDIESDDDEDEVEWNVKAKVT